MQFQVTKQLPLFLITVDDRLRVRKIECRDTIQEYQNCYSKGINLSPLTVVHDGQNYWLIDGFLRIKAAKNIGFETLEFNVYVGTFEEAKIEVLSKQNITNPARLSKKDRLHKIEIALSDPTLSQFNDHDLAKLLNVALKEVEQVRNKIKEEEDIEPLLLPLSLPETQKDYADYYQLSSNCAIAKEKPKDYKPDLIFNFIYTLDDCSFRNDCPTVDLIMDSSNLQTILRNRSSDISQTCIYWLSYGIVALINCSVMNEEFEDTKVKSLEEILIIIVSKLTNWKDKILIYNPEVSILSLPNNRYYLGVSQDVHYFEMELNRQKIIQQTLT